MFPLMMNDMVAEMIETYCHQALGWKLSGAGGGGYLILVADHPIENAIRICIRRKSD
jgi:galactokinase/mevalonate kinase-like predicted kinase